MKKECGLRLQRLILIHNDALKIGLDIILVLMKFICPPDIWTILACGSLDEV